MAIRAGDDPSVEHSVSRMRGGATTEEDTVPRWMAAALGALLIALLSFFAVRDRVSVDSQFIRIDSAQADAARQLSEHAATIREIRVKQDRVLADLADNGRKLDVLLAREYRQRN